MGGTGKPSGPLLELVLSLFEKVIEMQKDVYI